MIQSFDNCPKSLPQNIKNLGRGIWGSFFFGSILSSTGQVSVLDEIDPKKKESKQKQKQRETGNKPQEHQESFAQHLRKTERSPNHHPRIPEKCTPALRWNGARVSEMRSGSPSNTERRTNTPDRGEKRPTNTTSQKRPNSRLEGKQLIQEALPA